MAFVAWHFIGNKSRSCLNIKAHVTRNKKVTKVSLQFNERFMFYITLVVFGSDELQQSLML